MSGSSDTGFVRAICILLSRKTREALQHHDRVIVLAAYLYATAAHLRRHDGMAAMQQPFPCRCRGLTDAVRLFEELAATVPSALELYRGVVSALVAVDALFEQNGRFPIAVATQTSIARLDTDRADWCGEVHHWTRPRSEWTRLRDARGAKRATLLSTSLRAAPHDDVATFAPRGPEEYLSTPDDWLAHLGMHWQLPGRPRVVQVGISEMAPRDRDTVMREFGMSMDPNLVGGQMFRIALCPLGGPFHPIFRLDQGANTFAIHPSEPRMQSPHALRQHLETLFADARQHRLQMLVFPELTICEPARNHLRTLLRDAEGSSLVGVIAGSFHVWSRDRPEMPYNEAVVLGGDGRLLWSQQKAGSFRLTADQVLKTAQMFSPSPKVAPPGEVAEGILHGSELRVLDARLGRLAVLICADALDSTEISRAVEECRPDMLFVLSMTPKSHDFVDFSRRMRRLGISTLFVNAACACDPATDVDLAFAHLALPEGKGDAATGVRWRRRTALEGYDFARNTWHERGTGAYPLPEGRGIVLDLGVHFGPGTGPELP